MLTRLLWMLNPEAWNRSVLTTKELASIEKSLKKAIEKKR